MLIYLFIYINYNNYNNYEKFNVNVSDDTFENSDKTNSILPGDYINIKDFSIKYNGKSPDTAFDSPLMAVYYNKINSNDPNVEQLKDGYYWFKFPDARINPGPQYIYCIIDSDYHGGGWLLALRGVKNSNNFHYDSEYWTKLNTLNANYDYIQKLLSNNENKNNDYDISSIGENIYKENFTPEQINNYDAKLHTFNYYKATKWMAIFYSRMPDKGKTIIIGGDLNDNLKNKNKKRGWIWYEQRISYKDREKYSLLELFQSLTRNNNRIDLFSNYYRPSQQEFRPKDLDKVRKYNGINIWTKQPNFQFYGVNYNYDQAGSYNAPVRWGFAWNENAGNVETSNDVYNGIGLRYGKYSAGDFQRCCYSELGANSSIAFEWYVQ